MSVNDSEDVNAAVTNAAYLSRKSDSDTVAKVGLNDADVVSGTSITNIQREHNAGSSYTGRPVNQIKTILPTWTDTSVGNPADDLTQRSEALTVNAGSLQTSVDSLQTLVDKSLIWDAPITTGFAALAAASTANDIEILELPLKSIIHAIVIKHTTAFSGGSLSAYTLSLGLSGNLDKYILPFDVFQAVGDTIFSTAQLFALENFGGVTSIRLSAISVGDNLDQAVAGSVDVYIQRSLMP